jgi:hypothetical protein
MGAPDSKINRLTAYREPGEAARSSSTLMGAGPIVLPVNDQVAFRRVVAALG